MLYKTTGITAYDLMHDGSAFDSNFIKPSFLTSANLPTLKAEIERVCGMCEMSTVVPDQATDAECKSAVLAELKQWSTDYKGLFERIHELYTAQYNPLDNYDRTELTTTIADGISKINSTSNSTSTNTSTNTNTSNSTSTNTSTDAGTSVNASAGSGTSDSSSDSKIMPIDGSEAGDMVTTGGGSGHSANTSDSTSTAKNENEHSDSGVAQTAVTGNSTSENVADESATSLTEDSNNTTVTSRIRGNIGITSAMSLVSQEEALRKAFVSAVHYIAETFKAEMVLGYYYI